MKPNILRLLVIRSLFKHNRTVSAINGSTPIHYFLEDNREQVLNDLSKQLKAELQEIFEAITPDMTVSKFIQK